MPIPSALAPNVLTAAEKKRIEAAYRNGQALVAAGRLEEALAVFGQIVRHHPQIAEAHFQIATLLRRAGRLVDARAACEAALRLRPKEPALWLLLANIASEQGNQPATAIIARARRAGLPAELLERIAERMAVGQASGAMPAPSDDVRRSLARIEAAMAAGDEAGALKIARKAASKHPESPQLLVHLGSLLLTVGAIDEALEAVGKVVAAVPDAGAPWVLWSRLRKVRADDPLLAELERRHAAAREGSEDRRQMAFALAKAMEDIRADDRLFRYLNEANTLTAKRFPYGHEADARLAAETRAGYTPDLVRCCEGTGDSSFMPVFITGLPRSGTTLIEQILSSHPAVTAGGELAILTGKMMPLVRSLGDGDGDALAARLAQAGRDYVHEMAHRFPGRGIVTDKSISTYVHIGYVALALPRAKIIVVRRDPRDSGLALLKQKFTDGQHRYTYSMEWTAQFYRLFAEQVGFWREVAPEAFIEVWYEDVVADLEGQARRMIDYCGLDWDEACLDFHKNDRAVKTLSTAQVRQPIYSSSVGAWRRYEADLKPLLDALGPVDRLR